MLEIIQKMNLEPNPTLYQIIKFNKETSIFFDIETTGLSSHKNQIYLIGCMYYSDKNWYTIQWLCESLDEEKELIQAFLSFAKNYNTIYHYNGDKFDLPFLEKRIKIHKLLNFELVSVDLFWLIKPYKCLFNLENLKLTTVEQLLFINRKDKFTGKQLIGHFYHYVKSKKATYKDNLLLHNKEDLKSLHTILSLRQYNTLFNNLKSFDVKRCDNYLLINIQHHFDLPIPINISKGFIDLMLDSSKLIIKIAIFEVELKFFFDNFKDYYYLPIEDESIHKSVASFVDPSHRVKATRATCYTKKRGTFVPLYKPLKPNISTFKYALKDEISYIELSSLTSDNSILRSYVKQHISFLTT